MDLKTLWDERAIIQGLNRFARTLDGREWGSVAEVFAQDVTFHYGDGVEQSGIRAMTKQFSRFGMPAVRRSICWAVSSSR